MKSMNNIHNWIFSLAIVEGHTHQLPFVIMKACVFVGVMTGID